MYWIAISALIVGLVALVVGYRKNNRNMLAAAAVLMLVAGGVEDFADGFKTGVSDDPSAAVQTPAG